MGEAVWNVLNMVALLTLVALVLLWVFTFLFRFAAPGDSPDVLAMGTRYLQVRVLRCRSSF